MLVSEFLEHSAELYPEKTALIHQNKRLSFVEIDNRANSFANALIDSGFQKQDRALIYLDNSVESIVSLFGILKAGGIFVIVNPQVKSRKLEYILSDCQSAVLVTDSQHLKQIIEPISHLTCLRWIIVTDYERAYVQRGSNAALRVLSYNRIVEECSFSRPVQRCIDIDLAGLIYTSGSSGDPKGVMLTHRNIDSASDSIITYLENTASDIIINTLPLSFDYGLYQVLMSFKFGGTLVLEKGFI